MSDDKPDYIEAEEPNYPDLTDDEKKEYEGKTLPMIAAEIRTHWKEIKDLKERQKELNKKFESLSRYLAERMELTKMDGFKVKDIGTVYISNDNKPYVNGRDEFIAWLKANGHEGLVKETVHPMSLLGFVNERIENNLPLPPGVHNFILKRAKIRSR